MKPKAILCTLALGASAVLIQPPSTSHAATINTGDVFPDSAEVIAATPGLSSLFGDDTDTSLAQTFQVSEAFTLRSIAIGYEYDSRSDLSENVFDLEIFEVTDTHASVITAGTSVLLLSGLALPDEGRTEARFDLDTPLLLPATTGDAGYALQISGSANPGLEWVRTTATTGSVYDFGQAYENGEEKVDRDFIMALSSQVPEPTSMACLTLLIAGLTAKRVRCN